MLPLALPAGLAVKLQALAPTVTFMTTGHDDVTAPRTASSVAAADIEDERTVTSGQIRHTMWSVFRVADRAALDGRASRQPVTSGTAANPESRDLVADELVGLLDQAAAKGTVTRGCYDIQGLRADADYMFWWTAPSPDALQDIYVRFRRTCLGRASEPVWSVLALHRPAEFNKAHVPAFVTGKEPKAYLSLYPYVRSTEWYLLDPQQRQAMLAGHGAMGRDYPDVQSNTVSCFSLNDYEWVIALEADELHRIVDLMRHLRGAEARRHTRSEVPFFTGRRKPARELVTALS